MIMKPKSSVLSYLFLFCFILGSSLVHAQDLTPVKLPPPRTDGGRPLMQVLNDRSSSRSFSSDTIPVQVLSDMLWAAWGINRPESGRRTAPSASNKQEIDVYVVCAKGVFVYDAVGNSLNPVLAEDIRELTGTQPFVKDAPVNLVFVADFSKMGSADDNQKYSTASANTGYISENVYLYCASEGLATVVRGSVDKPTLEAAMKLRPEQKVILAQTVGYPAKSE
jgi:SagB-type dehydrogenase family enzyme